MEKKTKVLVVDLLMGAGKTTMAIKGIKNNDMKFIFVTEYLDEVERMIKQTGKLVQPETKFGAGSKRTHLLALLDEGANVAITHSLFKSLMIDDYDLFEGYKLIIDEVVSIIEPINISKDDMTDLIEQGRLVIDEDNSVSWNDNLDYDGNWNDLREKVLSGGVQIVNEHHLVWCMPIDVFTKASEVIILTYLFDGSLMSSYLKYHGIDYYKIPTLFFTNDKLQGIKANLNVYKGSKNKIGVRKKGMRRKPLTSTWYKDKNNEHKIKSLVNNINDWFNRSTESKTEDRGVGVFKENEDLFSKRATFIPINMRATNKYRNITAIAYLIDLNVNPTIEQFFLQKDIKVDRDLYSLAGMIQFLWRGCIRDSQKMDVFIPSLRMRNLLYNWLKIET